ncbi:MAG: hypothetical protein AABZ12_08605 [Planctomycetota bacterium]
MGERFHWPVPMWVVQYQLLGGHRRMGGVLAISTAVLVVGFAGFRRLLLDMPLATVAGGTLKTLAFLQCGGLVLGGCGAVHRAILRDFETRMLESHRLTPMSNIAVALGYLFGSTLQITSLFLLVTVFGVVLSLIASLRVDVWLTGSLLIASGAAALWSASVFVCTRLTKPPSPVGILVGLSILGNVGLVTVPGLGFLLCAYPVVLGCMMIQGVPGPTVPPAAVVGMLVVDAILTMFWLSCAAAKYRRPDLPALGAVRGLTLLTLWLVLGMIGLVAFRAVVGALGRSSGNPVQLDFQWAGTLVLSLVVMLWPIQGAVECYVLARRGTRLRGKADRVPAGVVAMLAAALIVGTSVLFGGDIWAQLPSATLSSAGAVMAWLLTGLAFLSAALFAYGVLLAAVSLLKSPKIAAGMVLALVWVVVPLADAAFAEAMRQYPHAFQLSVLFGMSPVGTLIALWMDVPAPQLGLGVAVQFALALTSVLMGHWALRRAFPGTPGSPSDPPTAPPPR